MFRLLSPLLLAATLAVGAAAPPLLADDDVQAKKLYRAKCSGCHRLHPKQEFSGDEWGRKLPEMARRAKLNPEQLATIAKYLGVLEETTAAPTPTPAVSQEPAASHL